MREYVKNSQLKLKLGNINSFFSQDVVKEVIMIDLNEIKGIIFDYGGTIDSNGKHWAEVLWESYVKNEVPISKELFREAYVYAERYLATNEIVTSEYNFYHLLRAKIDLQMGYLISKGILTEGDKTKEFSLAISDQCYNFVRELISEEKHILMQLHKKYPIVLVSNFYGNIHAVLNDFGLLECFDQIVESAVVGVRKPDPTIFRLGVEKLGLPATHVVVIGDSHDKDIVPATQIGCKTIWLKGIGWEKDDDNATADVVITYFMELKNLFHI